VVLSFDPAGDFGWCVLTKSGKRLESGTWKLHKPSLKQGGGIRLLNLRVNIMTLIDKYLTLGYRIAVIGYEYSVNLRGRVAAKVSGEYEGQIKVAAQERGIPFTDVAYADAKRAATGDKAKASKAQMVAYANARWVDREVVDDNEADACFVGVHLIETYGPGMIG